MSENPKVKIVKGAFLYHITVDGLGVGSAAFSRTTSSLGVDVTARYRFAGETEWTETNFAYWADFKKFLTQAAIDFAR